MAAMATAFAPYPPPRYTDTDMWSRKSSLALNAGRGPTSDATPRPPPRRRLSIISSTLPRASLPSHQPAALPQHAKRDVERALRLIESRELTPAATVKRGALGRRKNRRTRQPPQTMMDTSSEPGLRWLEGMPINARPPSAHPTAHSARIAALQTARLRPEVAQLLYCRTNDEVRQIP